MTQALAPGPRRRAGRAAAGPFGAAVAGFCRLVLAGAVLAASPAGAAGWLIKGHATITEAAAAGLPDDMPAFFRAAGKELGHLSGDPDRWKNPGALFLRAAESPDHFIDLEDLEGEELPSDRHKAAALILRLRHRPERTGMLPYALMEHFDRLSVAFADYRQAAEKLRRLRESPAAPGAPADALKAAEAELRAVEMKCLVHAGVLAHFTGDAAMPLHTTVDFDGRTKQKGPDGKKLQAGIHLKIDAFPENHGLTADEIARGLAARELDDPWKHVQGTIRASFTHVEKCYELDAVGAFDKPTAESRQFILDRCRVAARFTQDLWYTAWKRSAKLSTSR
jgi:hypothetical protein